MTQVTEVEYEAVEKEVTRYRCDQCKDVVTEDEINKQGISNGSDFTAGDVFETAHVCDDCVEMDRYLSLVDMADFKQSFAEHVAQGVNIGLNAFVTFMAIIVSTGMMLSYATFRVSPRVMDPSPLTTGDYLVVIFIGFVFAFLYLLAILLFVPEKYLL